LIKEAAKKGGLFFYWVECGARFFADFQISAIMAILAIPAGLPVPISIISVNQW
jgi:hypothetical protein